MLTPRVVLAFGVPLVCMAWLPACGGDDGSATNGDTASDTSGPTETATTDDPSTEEGDDTEEEPDPNLLEIPGGTFEMGCRSAYAPCDADSPPHEVTISAFSIEATEVTVLDYQACVDAGGCTAPDSFESCNYGLISMGNHPINCVSWDAAVDYCTWKGRRLPTEAEWEYVASGGADRPFPWGANEANCTRAHMFEIVDMMGDYGCMTGMTAPVGSYAQGASPFGALDMAGNVEEWVADWYADNYYSVSPTNDPQGPADGTQKVARGGDLFDASPANLRVFKRSRLAPTQASAERGFRCAAD
jgi:formylglycine-generating enzyme